MKLHRKLMISYLIAIIIPISGLAYLFLFQAENLIVRHVDESYRQLLHQESENIDYNMKYYQSIADHIMLTPAVQEALSDPHASHEKGLYVMSLEIRDAIRYVYAYRESDIETIRFYAFDPDVLYDGQYVFPYEKFHPRFGLADGEQFDDPRWMLFQDPMSGMQYYALLRPIYRISQFKKLGYMEMTIRIPSVVPPKEAGTDTSLGMVVDQHGMFMYHPDAELVGTAAPKEVLAVLADDMSPVRIVVDGQTYMAWKEAIPRVGWTAVLLVAMEEANVDLDRVRRTIFIIGGVGVVVFFLLVYFITRRLTTGLRSLHNKVRRVGKGLLQSEEPPPPGNDEISELDRSFDEMIDNLRKLIHENYVEKLQKRELELKVLQAQINPHFLYNTLEIIYWKTLQIGRASCRERV